MTELEGKLIEALRETREACASLMRAVAAHDDCDEIVAGWTADLAAIGIPNGFGVRADVLIRAHHPKVAATVERG